MRPPYDELVHSLDGTPMAMQVIVLVLPHTPPDAFLRDLQADDVTVRADNPAQGPEHSCTASRTERLNALDPTVGPQRRVRGRHQSVVDADVLAANLVNVSVTSRAREADHMQRRPPLPALDGCAGSGDS
jgi:hypothetical protein